MPRQKYQRPEVYAAGKREKLWKAEWREYFTGSDGKEHSRHKSKTWSRATHTKADAQTALDDLLREKRQGGPKADGSMPLKQFWDQVYYPIRAPKWSPNSRAAIASTWKLIKPLYGIALKNFTKADLDMYLLGLAKANKGQNTVEAVVTRLHSIFDEALENDYIPKNPARKVEAPVCKPPEETRSLTEDEVRKLWDHSEGIDYLLWRLLILTGPRISEALALSRSDVENGIVRIAHSALRRKAADTKNRKERAAPLPESLRAELEEWLSAHDGPLVFPHPKGKMAARDDIFLRDIRDRGRAAGIPDLTFRMCRTTFATLFEGDLKDAQAILGHHSEAFTLRVYRKPIAERQRQSVEAMDARLKIVEIKRRAG